MQLTVTVDMDSRKGLPVLDVQFDEIPEESKIQSYSAEDVQKAMHEGVLIGWAKAVEACADMSQRLLGESVALMENAGLQVSSFQRGNDPS